VLVAYPLTGAALNPARWFGPTLWELSIRGGRTPFADAFVYVAGPIVGAIIAGWWCFKMMPPRK
jgi:glycerol uptake facilitator-like aquaporin